MGLRRFRAVARCLAIPSLFALGACYSYIPADMGIQPKGTTVRTRVSGDPTYQVGDMTVRDVATVEGQIITWEPDSLALSALELRASGGESFNGQGYTIKLPRVDLSEFVVKRFSGKRTTLLILGTLVGGFLAQQGLTGGFFSTGGPGTGGTVK